MREFKGRVVTPGTVTAEAVVSREGFNTLASLQSALQFGDKTAKCGDQNNPDLYGKEMHFQFSGDDDLWVLIDGKVALDIGGIHQIVGGDINFSTGTVTINDPMEGIVTLDLEQMKETYDEIGRLSMTIKDKTA